MPKYRSRFHYLYNEAHTMRVEDGEGEETFRRLCDVYGDPEYPRVSTSSVHIRMQRCGDRSTLLAFEACGAPNVVLGPGVTLTFGTIYRAHWGRIPRRKPNGCPYTGHPKPPHLRGSWIDLAVRLHRESIDSGAE